VIANYMVLPIEHVTIVKVGVYIKIGNLLIPL
jgi:hypothetical protein